MRVLAVLMLLIAAPVCASANTVHELRFSQPAMVMVWQDGVLVGQGDRVVVQDWSAPSTADIPGSGVLLPESLGSASAQQRISLQIASNSGFTLRLADPIRSGEVSLRVLSVGQNAAFGRLGPTPTADLLLHQTAKTAARPGSPESQSIAFEVEWKTGSAPTLEVITLAP